MGLYNVIQPCVVGKLHHTRPTTQPIEVDDDVAAAGVEAGCLEPYRPGGIPGKTGTVLDGVLINPATGMTPQWHDATTAGQDAGETFFEGLTRMVPNLAEVAETMEPIAVEPAPDPKPRRPRKPRES